MSGEPFSSSPPVSAAVPRLVVRVRRVPGAALSAKIWLRGGARAEEIPGQALITGRLLTEGTRQRDWWRIVVDTEDRGMELSSSGTYESLYLSLRALTEDWQDALAWLAEMTFEPVFPEDRFTWVRRQAAAELEGLLDQPELRTAQAFLKQLYDPHPYGRTLFGSDGSLERLTRDDIVSFHRRALSWGALVAVAGDLDEDAVTRRIEELFASLAGPAAAIPAPPSPAAELPSPQKIVAGEADQAHLYAGHLTLPRRRHPDGPALDVLGVILGEGVGLCGRLPERIREKEGLAYSIQVATRSGAGLDPGRLVIYAGTSPATVEQAERAIREELSRLVEDGIRDDELEEARSYLIGRDPLTRQTAHQWADLLAEASFYGLPCDRPEGVVEELEPLTRTQVEEVARRWIEPDRLRVTVGLPR